MIGIDFASLGILFFCGAILYLMRKQLKKNNPAFDFSRTASLKKLPLTARLRWSFLPSFLFFLGIAFLALGFIDPHRYKVSLQKPISPLEGRAIYLVIDKSGSMGEGGEVIETPTGLVKLTKLEKVQKLILPFLDRHADDLIGLIAFSRGAEVLSPLTSDHEVLKDLITKMQTVKTPEQNGTAIGYALYKTVSLISSLKESKGRYKIRDPVVILLTDGLQDPNPADYNSRYRTISLEEAAREAHEAGIHLYMINMEPRILEAKYALNLREMQRAMALADGKVVMATTAKELEKSLREIERLEQSSITYSKKGEWWEKISYAYLFIGAGLISFFVSVLLGETYLRRIP